MGANAQIEVPAFTAGQVLTAAEVTQINTGIPVFATTTTRDAAFGGAGEKVLAEGQFAYIEASNQTQFYDGAAWTALSSRIVQVVTANKTSAFTTTSATFTDVTGLSVSITPTSATSTILVLSSFMVGCDPTATSAFIRLMRGATAIDVGDAAGSRIQASNDISAINGDKQAAGNIMFIDSPATTTATTYKIQVASPGSTTVAFGASSTDTNSAGRARTVCSITVMEIAA